MRAFGLAGVNANEQSALSLRHGLRTGEDADQDEQNCTK